MMCALSASAVEAYACYTPSNTTLTFYYDNMRSSRTGVTYDLNRGDWDPAWVTDQTNAEVTRAVFNSSFANARPVSTYSWFYEMKNLQAIEGINYLNTSQTKYMGYMFYYCSALTTLDVSHFNTANVTDMSGMFAFCINLSYIDVSHFDTSNVGLMPSMFYGCIELQSLDVRNFNTSKVYSMHAMFGYCSNYISVLDLSSFDTSKVAYFGSMFYNDMRLTTIYVGGGWSTASVFRSEEMFTGCTSLVGGKGTTYDDNHVDIAYAQVDGGTSSPGYLTTYEAYACYTPSNRTLTFYFDDQRIYRSGNDYDLNKSSINPGWVDDLTCADVTRVVFDPSFANARPTTTYSWFYYMRSLKSIQGINYLNTSQVTNMGYMFALCDSLPSLDVSHFNTANVEDMQGMFWRCQTLTSLDLSSFNASVLRYSSNMFAECTNLQDVTLGSGITELDANAFKDCYHLTNVTCLSTTPPTLTYSSFMPSHFILVTVHVPQGFRSAYENANIWSDFSNFHELTTGGVFEVDRIYYKDDGYGTVLVTSNGLGQYGCYSDTVEIPEEVINPDDGLLYHVTGIGERAFYQCTDLKSVTIPASVDIIHNEAFMDAFYNVNGASVTCMALLPPTISPSAFNPYDTEVMTLYVPNGKKSAYEARTYWDVFGGIEELNYSIKKDDFYYKITGQGTVNVTYKDSNYKTYSGYVTIPETVTSNQVTYTVTAIDNVAFFDCPNLTGVVIPETVTTIGNTTFKNCPLLKNVTIPNSVTSMGLYAFQNCTSLSDVVIGSGMTSIGLMAFHGCTALETGSITCNAVVPPTLRQRNVFDDGHYNNTHVYVPKESWADYAQEQYWRDFMNLHESWSLDEALNVRGGTIHFESTGDYPWRVVCESGDYYAMSGNAGVRYGVSTLTAIVNVPEDTPLSFNYKAWGETNSSGTIHYDKCEFSIDGSIVMQAGAEQNQEWSTFSTTLPAGIHALAWSYTKDSLIDPEGDFFAIDDVRLGNTLVGDVDGNGSVGIADVTLLIDFILNGDTTAVDLSVSDVNGDGNVGIADATSIIDYILSGTW